MKELTTETDSFFRPNFWPNTPDILPHFLQWGGKPAFTIRAVLGSTLSPLWGIYSGFELFENAALGSGPRGVPGLGEVPVPAARLEGRRRERREPQHAARQAEPDPQRAPCTAAAPRLAFPPRPACQRAGLFQEERRRRGDRGRQPGSAQHRRDRALPGHGGAWVSQRATSTSSTTSSPDKRGAGDSMPSSGSPTTIRRTFSR